MKYKHGDRVYVMEPQYSKPVRMGIVSIASPPNRSPLDSAPKRQTIYAQAHTQKVVRNETMVFGVVSMGSSRR